MKALHGLVHSITSSLQQILFILTQTYLNFFVCIHLHAYNTALFEEIKDETQGASKPKKRRRIEITITTCVLVIIKKALWLDRGHIINDTSDFMFDMHQNVESVTVRESYVLLAWGCYRVKKMDCIEVNYF